MWGTLEMRISSPWTERTEDGKYKELRIRLFEHTSVVQGMSFFSIPIFRFKPYSKYLRNFWNTTKYLQSRISRMFYPGIFFNPPWLWEASLLRFSHSVRMLFDKLSVTFDHSNLRISAMKYAAQTQFENTTLSGTPWTTAKWMIEYNVQRFSSCTTTSTDNFWKRQT